MKKPNKTASPTVGLSRRGFLCASGGVAAGAVPAAAVAVSDKAHQLAGSRDNRRVILKDTDHIRTYYAMARS
jgi:hypothetical protein